MLDVLPVVFGLQTRTPYYNLTTGELTAYFQCVIYPDKAIRYTTNNGVGVMDVYFYDSVFIGVDSARDIQCDVNGNPTSITGVQRYFPSPVYLPRWMPTDNSIVYNNATGYWGWCPGDCYPATPGPERFRHEISAHCDGINLWVDENFYYPDGAGLVYSRGFLYSVRERCLLQYTDHITGYSHAPK